MAYEIIWLPKAEQRYEQIIEWLYENWTAREIENFVARTDEILELISISPEIFRVSERKNIRQVVITKHNTLLYRKKGKIIELITFFDTRQKPNKKFK